MFKFLPSSPRFYRVAFIIAVIWVVQVVCFFHHWQHAFNASPSTRGWLLFWLAVWAVVSIGFLIWAIIVNPKSRLGRIGCFIELVVFNLALSVFLLEVALRSYGAITNNPFTLPAGFKDATLVNNRRTERKQQLLLGFPFNSDGFFDTEFVRPKPDDVFRIVFLGDSFGVCLLYTSPSPRDRQKSRMPSSA